MRADLHGCSRRPLTCCYCCNAQVIGLLGGTWNPDTRQLVVIEAYACRRAEGSDAATSVELDPAAQVEVQHLMEQKGQKCVGW